MSNCQTYFYEDLYKKVNPESDISFHSILSENDNKLTDKDSKELEGEVLYSELRLA